MNSDLFTDADFEELYLSTVEQNAVMGEATVPYHQNNLWYCNNLRNQITGLKKTCIYELCKCRYYIINTCILNKIPKNTFFNITDLMEQLIADLV